MKNISIRFPEDERKTVDEAVTILNRNGHQTNASEVVRVCTRSFLPIWLQQFGKKRSSSLKKIALGLIGLAEGQPEATAEQEFSRGMAAVIRKTVVEFLPEEFSWAQILALLTGKYPTKAKRINRELGARLANMVEAGELFFDEEKRRWFVLGINDGTKTAAELNHIRLKRRMELEKNL